MAKDWHRGRREGCKFVLALYSPTFESIHWCSLNGHYVVSYSLTIWNVVWMSWETQHFRNLGRGETNRLLGPVGAISAFCPCGQLHSLTRSPQGRPSVRVRWPRMYAQLERLLKVKWMVLIITPEKHSLAQTSIPGYMLFCCSCSWLFLWWVPKAESMLWFCFNICVWLNQNPLRKRDLCSENDTHSLWKQIEKPNNTESARQVKVGRSARTQR